MSGLGEAAGMVGPRCVCGHTLVAHTTGLGEVGPCLPMFCPCRAYTLPDCQPTGYVEDDPTGPGVLYACLVCGFSTGQIDVDDLDRVIAVHADRCHPRQAARPRPRRASTCCPVCDRGAELGHVLGIEAAQ